VVLDVGCGPGNLLERVKPGQLIGIDPLVPFFTREFSRIYQNGVCSVGEAIPMRVGSVTKLFCCNALDHTLNPQNVLKELCCVLNDNGFLLLSCTGYSSPDKLFQKFKEFTRLFRYDPHPSFFTISDIRKLLLQCGFQVVSVERISVPRGAESKSAITRMLDKLGKNNSGMFAFIAKKSLENRPTPA
jgi:SAM-dependent methyltransferase